MTRAIGGPLLAALVLLLAGCPCDRGYPEMLHDRMETACGDLPCGWERIAGTVELVTTWHSGQHGLWLADGGVARRTLGSFPVSRDMGEFLLSVGVDCDGEATLLFAVTVAVGADGPVVFAGRGASLLSSDDGDDIVEPRLVRLSAPEDVDLTNLPELLHIESIEVELMGEGSCVMDDLRILSGDLHQCMG